MSLFLPNDGAAKGQVEPPAAPGRAGSTAARLSRRERGGLIILFAMAAVLLFGALGSKQLWKSEARWGQVAREMMRTGDYFRPTINGKEYLDKPLLGYWLVVLAAKATGELNEWAVRLPSALAGLAVLAATVSLGRRLWSARVAITAGWLLLTSYGFLFYARIGMADMENVAAIMLALAWYWRNRDRPGLAAYAGFYLICALGAQTKGLTAILVPMAAVFPDLVFGGRWRRNLSARHALGAMLGAAAYLAPFLLSPGSLALVYRENIERAVDTFDHAEPVYAYLYHVPILFLPWSPVLIVAIVWVIRRWKQVDVCTRWLALAMLLVFAMFTASGSRRSYYILPILPPAALLCAVSLWSPGPVAWKRLLVRVAGWVAIGAAAALLLLGPMCVWLLKRQYDLTLPAALTWGTPAIGLLALALLLLCRPRVKTAGTEIGRPVRRPRWPERLAVYPGLAPITLTAMIILGGFFCIQHPAMDSLGGHRGFAAELQARLPGPPGTALLGVYDEMPATFVFYMNQAGPMYEIQTSAELDRFLSLVGPKPGAIVSQKRDQWRLRDLGFPTERIKRPDVQERTLPWQGDADDDDRLRAFILNAPATMPS